MAGIAHFSRIDNAAGFAGALVGFGGKTPDSEMAWLQNQGFRSVVNLRLAGEEGVDVSCSEAAAEAAGLKYIHLPFSPQNFDPAVVEDFLSAVSDQANQPVFIHCASATRVAALWILGRVLTDNWELEAASREAETIAHKPAEAIAFATAYLQSRSRD